jgi:hypothetical protein
MDRMNSRTCIGFGSSLGRSKATLKLTSEKQQELTGFAASSALSVLSIVTQIFKVNLCHL